MKIELRELQLNEPQSVYDYFMVMPADENGLKNSAAGLSESEFAEWVKKQIDYSKGVGLPEGLVPNTFFILFIDDVPVGNSKMRHYLTPALENHGGHIGYRIAPEHRGKGYANIMLAETLKHAKAMGIEKVLLTTDADNAASYKTIERNGGILEKIEDGSRYYWITV
ncbi:MAG: GNAT family N-acetyltransferase [Alphaproteobacteria bacterium]|nr:GNAT family N-acetyltransferase [Alphaproteobacteria bacterium]